MRATGRFIGPAVALALIAGIALAQEGPTVERWRVQATGPVTLTMGAAGAVTGAWARSTDGAWHQLETTAADGRIGLTLGAEALRGGSALVIINPPDGLDLDDVEPPAVVRFTIDSIDYAGEANVDLGWIADMPGEIALAVQDEHNRIDLGSARVTAGGTILRPGEPGVQFGPHGEMAGTLRVRPGQIEGLVGVTRARVELAIDDYAVDDEDTRRSVSWALAPVLITVGGTVVSVDSLTSADGWADWSVVVDGDVMTDSDNTTAGVTWLSDNREDEHWLRFDFPEPRTVDGIELWWPFYQTWRTSRDYEVQTWDGAAWVTQVQVADQEEGQHSEHRFASVTTTRVRVLQAPMGGQAERQDLMWIAEAQVHFAE